MDDTKKTKEPEWKILFGDLGGKAYDAKKYESQAIKEINIIKLTD
jgi:hypothetical protein